jgi:hypothetical protein
LVWVANQALSLPVSDCQMVSRTQTKILMHTFWGVQTKEIFWVSNPEFQARKTDIFWFTLTSPIFPTLALLDQASNFLLPITGMKKTHLFNCFLIVVSLSTDFTEFQKTQKHW